MKARFDRLLALQNQISLRRNQRYIGMEVEVLCEGVSKTNRDKWTGRTAGGRIVNFSAARPARAGELRNVLIEEAQTWSLRGRCLSDG
jgi:tRNA-2-methylthio-N6-dimethylallyladenosine synthase